MIEGEEGPFMWFPMLEANTGSNDLEMLLRTPALRTPLLV